MGTWQVTTLLAVLVVGFSGPTVAGQDARETDAQPVAQKPQPADAKPRRLVIRRSTPALRQVRRVRVAYLNDRPENIRLRADLNTFLIPHTSDSPHDPATSARWALDGSFLARHAKDQRQLRSLYHFRDMRDRKNRLLTQQAEAIAGSLELMSHGEYRRAVVLLSLAARMNQADPASRIHLAQARLALGQFTDAAKALRRALELQPHLAYIDLDLGAYYASPDDLETFTDRLDLWISERTATTEDEHLLLGYLRSQDFRFDDAHRAFICGLRIAPRDELLRELASVTKPVSRR